MRQSGPSLLGLSVVVIHLVDIDSTVEHDLCAPCVHDVGFGVIDDAMAYLGGGVVGISRKFLGNDWFD